MDSHVAKHIFDNVIGPDGMLRKKVRFKPCLLILMTQPSVSLDCILAVKKPFSRQWMSKTLVKVTLENPIVSAFLQSYLSSRKVV